ncbi:hypothetical protein COLO4_00859 [Corchorus olitorius]|uniref:Uncharacterized protein n=1 Tax=Corchorus olitorius TaxID=93759 RepID=A0A1R3L3E7_9ROSI|nr:hypothetical protein COLO4_00859 [Corchorus olitorius]
MARPADDLERVEVVEIDIGRLEGLRAAQVGLAAVIPDQLDDALARGNGIEPERMRIALVGATLGPLDELVLRVLLPLDRAAFEAEGQARQRLVLQAVAVQVGVARRGHRHLAAHRHLGPSPGAQHLIHARDVSQRLGLFAACVGERDDVRPQAGRAQRHDHGRRVHARAEAQHDEAAGEGIQQRAALPVMQHARRSSQLGHALAEAGHHAVEVGQRLGRQAVEAQLGDGHHAVIVALVDGIAVLQVALHDEVCVLQGQAFQYQLVGAGEAAELGGIEQHGLHAGTRARASCDALLPVGPGLHVADAEIHVAAGAGAHAPAARHRRPARWPGCRHCRGRVAGRLSRYRPARATRRPGASRRTSRIRPASSLAARASDQGGRGRGPHAGSARTSRRWRPCAAGAAADLGRSEARSTVVAVLHGRHEAGRVQRSVEAGELARIGQAEGLEVAFALVALGVGAGEGVSREQHRVAALARGGHQAAARQRHPYANSGRAGHVHLTRPPAGRPGSRPPPRGRRHCPAGASPLRGSRAGCSRAGSPSRPWPRERPASASDRPE